MAGSAFYGWAALGLFGGKWLSLPLMTGRRQIPMTRLAPSLLYGMVKLALIGPCLIFGRALPSLGSAVGIPLSMFVSAFSTRQS
jgi:hypothetical protein